MVMLTHCLAWLLPLGNVTSLSIAMKSTSAIK
jgi:hypothetical protein